MLFAEIRIHQQVELFAHQQVYNRKVNIIAEVPLLYTQFKESNRFLGIAVASLHQFSIDFRVFLDVFKKLFISIVKLLDTPLVEF